MARETPQTLPSRSPERLPVPAGASKVSQKIVGVSASCMLQAPLMPVGGGVVVPLPGGLLDEPLSGEPLFELVSPALVLPELLPLGLLLLGLLPLGLLLPALVVPEPLPVTTLGPQPVINNATKAIDERKAICTPRHR